MNFKQLLTFTKKDLMGILALVVVIAFVTALPHLIDLFYAKAEMREMIALNHELIDSIKKSGFTTIQPINQMMAAESGFTVDPNEATETDWMKMGLPSYKAKMIHHYVDKGGRFFRAEDLKRIYCITDKDYALVVPHLVFRKRNNFGTSNESGRSRFRPYRRYHYGNRYQNSDGEDLGDIMSLFTAFGLKQLNPHKMAGLLKALNKKGSETLNGLLPSDSVSKKDKNVTLPLTN